MPPKTPKTKSDNPEQELTSIKRIKANLNSSLDNMEDFITKFDDSSHISQLEVRYPHLDEIFSKFSDIHLEMEKLLPKDDTLFTEFTTFQNKYFHIKSLFKQKIDLLKQPNVSSAAVDLNTEIKQIISDLHNTSSENKTHEGPSSQPLNLHTPISLPKLTLPQFKGNYVEWQSFKDLFTSVIINNPQLTQIQRFYYLKSVLKGEALSLVKNIAVTDDNFLVAWQILVSRYDNKLATINDHLKILVDMPAISKGYSLREFTVEIKQNLDSLKNLLTIDTWDIMIIFLVSQKLDFKTKEAWEFSRDQSSLPSISEFL